eukprot:1327351-Rhodomonas_salina.1
MGTVVTQVAGRRWPLAVVARPRAPEAANEALALPFRLCSSPTRRLPPPACAPHAAPRTHRVAPPPWAWRAAWTRRRRRASRPSCPRLNRLTSPSTRSLHRLSHRSLPLRQFRSRRHSPARLASDKLRMSKEFRQRRDEKKITFSPKWKTNRRGRRRRRPAGARLQTEEPDEAPEHPPLERGEMHG